MPAIKVLVVEDDPRLAASLRQGLSEEGYDVVVARTGALAREAMARGGVELLVLDLGLPDADGIELLKEFRGAGQRIPVLILSARDALKDRVKGLDTGADDYLVKPFAFPELIARLHALHRRRQAGDERLLQVEDLAIDLVGRTVRRGGTVLELTAKEFDLLVYLARTGGQIVSREMLVRDVWKVAARATPMDNIIDVHISHLREKLDRGFERRLLRTVRGVGYVLGGEA